jgi:hypothetical protein
MGASRPRMKWTGRSCGQWKRKAFVDQSVRMRSNRRDQVAGKLRLKRRPLLCAATRQNPLASPPATIATAASQWQSRHPASGSRYKIRSPSPPPGQPPGPTRDPRPSTEGAQMKTIAHLPRSSCITVAVACEGSGRGFAGESYPQATSSDPARFRPASLPGTPATPALPLRSNMHFPPTRTATPRT